MIKIIEGGVGAAKGYTAGGIYCGIRKRNDKNDLALIFSIVPAHAAAVYTTNLVKGAPLTVTKQHIADGIAQAVICNSGNANTCNSDGPEIAEKMSALAAEQLGISPRDVIVASTGVIGQKLNITPIANGMETLTASLSESGDEEAAKAIMTTDTVMKKIKVLLTAFTVFILMAMPAMADIAGPPYYYRRGGISGLLLVMIIGGIALAAAILIYFGIKGKRK